MVARLRRFLYNSYVTTNKETSMKTRQEELKEMINDLGNSLVKDLTLEQCRQLDNYIKYKVELANLERS